MSVELTKAELVRSYAETESYKTIVAQYDTTVAEETLFQSVLAEGRDLTDKYSEIQKAKSWYDCLSLFSASIDENHGGGKLLKEFVVKNLERVREAVIKGADLRDYKVYTELDWKRLGLAQRRECLRFVEACANSFDAPKPAVDNANPYKKAE